MQNNTEKYNITTESPHNKSCTSTNIIHQQKSYNAFNSFNPLVQSSMFYQLHISSTIAQNPQLHLIAWPCNNHFKKKKCKTSLKKCFGRGGFDWNTDDKCLTIYFPTRNFVQLSLSSSWFLEVLVLSNSLLPLQDKILVFQTKTRNWEGNWRNGKFSERFTAKYTPMYFSIFFTTTITLLQQCDYSIVLL